MQCERSQLVTDLKTKRRGGGGGGGGVQDGALHEKQIWEEKSEWTDMRTAAFGRRDRLNSMTCCT